MNRWQVNQVLEKGRDNMRSIETMGTEHLDRREYRRLSLLELAQRIVRDSDPLAVRELHDHRHAFRHWGNNSLRLAEFLERLGQAELAREWVGGRQLALDQAYDLTLDKFRNLPPSQQGSLPLETRSTGQSKHKGPDCRHYFKAFLNYAAGALSQGPTTSQLQQERKAAMILQKLVTRHFYLSCLECGRSSNRLVKRYFWRVGDGTICVWLPSYMTGREGRSWLAANVVDTDARRGGETERVQSIVNERLLLPRLFSRAKFDEEAAVLPRSSQSAALLEAISVRGLAGAVAEEKAENIDRLRPSIRALGKSALMALIHRVFDDLASACFELNAVASSFGLSKATLSRFAGTKWSARMDCDQSSCAPDLWRNTAQTLAGHPDFVGAAKAVGVWPRIESVLACEPEGGAH